MTSDLFPQDCSNCVVREWCTLRTGTVKLPVDYLSDRCNSKFALYTQLSLCKIPPEYLHANLHNFELNENNSSQYAMLKNMLEKVLILFNEKKMNLLLIHAKRGVGKTYTALSFLNQYIYKTALTEQNDFVNPVGMYVKFGEWANNIRKMYQIQDHAFSRKVYEDMDNMKEVPLLIIDEIGSGRITDVIVDHFYDIVDYRKEYQLPTIFTSNLTLDQLAKNELLGERIVSRMKYNAFTVTFGNTDLRIKNN